MEKANHKGKRECVSEKKNERERREKERKKEKEIGKRVVLSSPHQVGKKKMKTYDAS